MSKNESPEKLETMLAQWVTKTDQDLVSSVNAMLDDGPNMFTPLEEINQFTQRMAVLVGRRSLLNEFVELTGIEPETDARPTHKFFD